ncbi:MAG: hypothetical protein GWP04_05660 [Gammaproteobacteria bacterium]|nr:hypothetical protein [Gammaproteobacteria bacterium]
MAKRRRNLLVAALVPALAIVTVVAVSNAEPDSHAVPNENRLTAALTSIAAYQNGLLVSGFHSGGRAQLVVALRDGDVPFVLGDGVQARLTQAEQQLPKLRSLLAELGEQYSHFKTEITVEATNRLDNGNLEVRYVETTYIYYQWPHEHDDGAPEYSAYSADYVARFSRSVENSWSVDSIELVDGTVGSAPFIRPITEPVPGREIATGVAELAKRLDAAYDEAIVAGSPAAKTTR